MTKPLSLNEIRANAAKFANYWATQEGKEKQRDQDFMRELLAVYGLADRIAQWQYQATRFSKGRIGWLDALIPGQLGIEMKTAGEDLAKAEAQALDYALPDTVAPVFMLTSDFHRFRLKDLRDGTVAEWPLHEFPGNAERLAFLGGYGVRNFGSVEQEAASIQAAKIMGNLYEELERSGYEDHAASVFLVRTLFALFADDGGMFPKDLFAEFIRTRTQPDGTDLGSQLRTLYEVLGTPEDKRQRNLDELLGRFPYVSGAVFDELLPTPAFDSKMREKLLDSCDFNWAAISPAVFGSLFQSVKSKEARRELGEHYTTEANILKLIGPMFLDELNERVAAGWSEAKKLERIRTDMGRMRFLDPACGCGNFLVVGYRELRALDLKILLRLQELDPGKYMQSMFFLAAELPVKLGHFYGIELEEWPGRIAATALHLVEHQANAAMHAALGDAPDTLPLNKVETIFVGNALRTDWTEVVAPSENLYILGNPPFLGHATRSDEQAQELRHVWHRDDIGRLDYVTGWYAKALDLLRRPGYAGEFAYVSTNSITQGEPVSALFGPVFDDGWRIGFAHRTFAWTSEAPKAAAVHCVVVGFDKNPKKRARIFGYDELRGLAKEVPVREGINGYLVDGPNLLVEQRSTPLSTGLPNVTMGSMPRDGGHLIVEADDYAEVVADPIASKYLRRFMMGKELVHNLPRWCLWMVDLDPADIAKSPVLRQRIAAVEKFRSESTAASTRQMATTPYLFGQRSQPSVPYVGIPKVVSEDRRWMTVDLLGSEVIAGDKVYKCEDPDGFAFAVFSSSVFILWQKTVGGRLKSDVSFSNTIVWNTLPLPIVTPEQRTAIIAGGQAVLEARAQHPGRSLAAHYAALGMDPALVKAHATLDKAVDIVFGLKGQVADADRLAALFSSYERLIAAD
ncbi:MAG TPA: class I SAM-dependent DNA methyltransferase [Acidimicrobiaceae bacterium]|nr:class I SAM-dependent DNA methyltransferase [Acidimicrobiaceae bacterium]